MILEGILLEPFSEGSKTLFEVFSPLLGSLRVAINAETFLGDILELLALKFRQSRDGILINSLNKVDNLIATIDYNGRQIDGDVEDVMSLGN